MPAAPIRKSIVLALLTLTLAGCAKHCADSVPGSFTAVLADTFSPDQPGVAAIVVKDGETLFRSAVGLADVGQGIPLKAGMSFRIGSLTKPLTAAAIMLLSDQGRLSVGDDITRYLPDYPTHGNTITIEHLLTHTSGIRNYTDLPGFEENMANAITVTELIDLFKHELPDFEPGARFSYSNSDYILLGAIIERVSAQPYCTYMQQHLFVALGMANTACDTDAPSASTTATGYTRNRKAAPISVTQTFAAGALVSTVDDLAAFNRAIASAALLKPETWDRIFTPFVFNDGNLSTVGYGWGLGTVKGHAAVAHEGKINGFSSMMIRVPGEKLFVAVLSNDDRLHLLSRIESWFDNNSMACIAGRLAAIALGGS